MGKKKFKKSSSRQAQSTEKSIRQDLPPDEIKEAGPKIQSSRIILSVLVVVYFVLTFFLLYQRYIYLEMKEPTDSPAFMQICWSLLHGTPYSVSVIEHSVKLYPYNFFSKQLLFTLALFSIFFLFTSSGISFLILQSLIISLAAVPLYFLAEQKLKDEWLALLITIAYLFNPITYESFEKFGFRPETLLIPALFAMFYFIEREKLWQACVSLLFVLLTKHNMIMLVFLLGLYYLIFDNKRRRFGLFCLVAAVGYYLIGVRTILFHFQTGETGSLKHLAIFGKTHKEVLINMLLNPGKILEAISPMEWQYSYRILFPAGFLALLHPVFWVCLPQLIMNALLGDYHSIYCAWHWAAVVPFLFVGIVYTMKWILNKFHKKTYITYILFALLFIGLYNNLIDFNETVLAADKTYYYKQNNIDTTKIIDRLSIIEPDASVMVSGQLLWFFAARENVYNAWVKFHDEVEYIVILLPMGQPGYGNIDRHMLIEAQNPNSKYFKKFRVISQDKHLVILKNKNTL